MEWQEPVGLDERDEEIDASMTSYDPAKDIYLRPQWEGTYKLRVLPVMKRDDWLRQMGTHWNIVPPSDDQKMTILGCPRFNYGQECPICDAIDQAIAERRAVWQDFGSKDYGGSGIAVNRRFLLKVLLLDFKAKEGQKKIPKFKDLPLVRVFEFPASMAKELKQKRIDEDFGNEALFHPEKGKVIKLTKDQTIQNWWRLDMLNESPIPEELLVEEEWPNLDLYIPKTTTSEIYQLLASRARDIDPLLANYITSHDVGQKQIEEATTAKAAQRKKIADI